MKAVKKFLLLGICAISLAACDYFASLGAPDDGSTSGKVATPQFGLGGGTYTSARRISITTSTPGAKIYYSTDGSDPAPKAAGTSLYSAPLALDAMHNRLAIKAIGVYGGMAYSDVASCSYALDYDRTGTVALPAPVISPASGVYSSDQVLAARTVTIACSDPDADIYYSFNENRSDGLNPTPFEDATIPNGDGKKNPDGSVRIFNAYYASFRQTRLYTGPISIPADDARTFYYVKAIAVRSGYADSPVSMVHYRAPGVPTIESFSVSLASSHQVVSKSAVGERIAIDFVIRDDDADTDTGLSQVRFSIRDMGHGTTNPTLDPTMTYLEYSPGSDQFTAYDYYDAVNDENIERVFTAASGATLDLANYVVYPSSCSYAVEYDSGSKARKLTLHYELSPKASEYDAVDLWKDKKSIWCWIGDGSLGGGKFVNNPVNEIGRWEVAP